MGVEQSPPLVQVGSFSTLVQIELINNVITSAKDMHHLEVGDISKVYQV